MIDILFEKFYVKCIKKNIMFFDDRICELITKRNDKWGDLYNVDLDYTRSWGGRKICNNIFYKVLISSQADFKSFYSNYLELLDSLEVNSDLNIKALSYGYPWDQSIKDTKYKTINNELKKYGFESGDKKPLCYYEAKRLFSIFNSFYKTGVNYRSFFSDPIIGDLINYNDNLFVLIRHGEHRVPIFKYFGFQKIPILLSSTRYYVFKNDFCNFEYSNYSKNEVDIILKNIYEGNESAPLINIKGYFFE